MNKKYHKKYKPGTELNWQEVFGKGYVYVPKNQYKRYTIEQFMKIFEEWTAREKDRKKKHEERGVYRMNLEAAKKQAEEKAKATGKKVLVKKKSVLFGRKEFVLPKNMAARLEALDDILYSYEKEQERIQDEVKEIKHTVDRTKRRLCATDCQMGFLEIYASRLRVYYELPEERRTEVIKKCGLTPVEVTILDDMKPLYVAYQYQVDFNNTMRKDKRKVVEDPHSVK